MRFQLRSGYVSFTPSVSTLTHKLVVLLAGEMLVSLLHMGLRIAQNLNLHILVAEPEGKDDLPPPGLRSRELKRAIWSALSLGDACVPFSDSSSSRAHLLFLSSLLQTLSFLLTTPLSVHPGGYLRPSSEPSSRPHHRRTAFQPRASFDLHPAISVRLPLFFSPWSIIPYRC